MKVHVVVKYTDVDVIDPSTGEETHVTETQLIEAYSTKQDANFESKCLNNQNTSNNVMYTVVEIDLN